MLSASLLAKHFTHKRDAQAFLVDVQHRLSRGERIDLKAGHNLLEDWWVEWASRQLWRPRTVGAVADSAARVLPLLGKRPVGSLRSADVQKALVMLSEAGLAPGTVRLTWQHLRSCLRAAQADGLLAQVPKVVTPRAESKVAIPTAEEIDALYAAATPRMRLAICLEARAGLRRSEALGLTVDRIDRERATITVDRQAAQRGAREPFAFAPLKTAASHRVVPVSTETIEELPMLVDAEHGLVLDVDGRPWADTVFGVTWPKLAHQVGIRCSFHDLRHYFCSTLLASGINPKAVAKVAGHSSPAVTLQTYAHVMPDDDERIRQALSGAVAPVVVLRTN